jgi:hypothetical protein
LVEFRAAIRESTASHMANVLTPASARWWPNKSMTACRRSRLMGRECSFCAISGCVRDFQQIIAQGISSALLEWKGKEAAETVAKSNAKAVVIGNNKNGLPLILGQ